MLVVIHIINVSVNLIRWSMIYELIWQLCPYLVSLWFGLLIELLTRLDKVILFILGNESATARAYLILIQSGFVLLGEETSNWMFS